jgi:hypothetical protein
MILDKWFYQLDSDGRGSIGGYTYTYIDMIHTQIV